MLAGQFASFRLTNWLRWLISLIITFRVLRLLYRRLFRLVTEIIGIGSLVCLVLHLLLLDLGIIMSIEILTNLLERGTTLVTERGSRLGEKGFDALNCVVDLTFIE